MGAGVGVGASVGVGEVVMKVGRTVNWLVSVMLLVLVLFSFFKACPKTRVS